MGHLLSFIITLADAISSHAALLFSALSGGGWLSASGSGMVCAFAAGMVFTDGSTESGMSGVRRWRGSIAERFSSIDNLVNVIRIHQPEWATPDNLLSRLIDNRNRLQELIDNCRSASVSRADREQRDSLLKSTIELCLTQVKTWALDEFAAGTLTADDVHQLGFPLPGETGRHRSRTADDAEAEKNATTGVFGGMWSEAELRRRKIESLKAELNAKK